MLCAICYHLYNLKNMKNTHGGLIILVRLCSLFIENVTPWVFLTCFRLYKCCQIAQSIIHKQTLVQAGQTYYRSSRPEVFCKEAVLENFSSFTRQNFYRNFFLNEAAANRLQVLNSIGTCWKETTAKLVLHFPGFTFSEQLFYVTPAYRCF